MIRGYATVGWLATIACVLSGLLAGHPSSALCADVVADEGDARIPAKVLRYSQRLIDRYDANGDGDLQQSEWSRMQGEPEAIDRDRDGKIAMSELAQYIANYGRRRKIRLLSAQLDALAAPTLLHPTTAAESGEAGEAGTATKKDAPPGPTRADAVVPTPEPDPRAARKFHVSPGNQPQGMPDWFLTRDSDGDGQLTMAEFAPTATRTDIAEFTRYDTNGDGLITASECSRANQAAAAKSSPKP